MHEFEVVGDLGSPLLPGVSSDGYVTLSYTDPTRSYFFEFRLSSFELDSRGYLRYLTMDTGYAANVAVMVQLGILIPTKNRLAVP
jgi:hypothetical protein